MADGSDWILDRQRWVRGSAWLFAGNGLGMLMTAISGILLARHIGPAAFGLYSVVVVGISLATTVVTFRLEMHLATVLTPGADDRNELWVAIRASVLVAMPVCGIGLPAALILSPVPLLVAAIATCEIILAPLLLTRTVLQVRGRQESIAVAGVCNRVVWTIAVASVVLLGPGNVLAFVVSGRLAAAIAETLLLARAVGPAFNPTQPAFAWPSAEVAALRASAPLAAAGIAGTAYNRSDQMLLAAIRGRIETGVYAAGVRLADLLLVLGPIVQSVSLPAMVELDRRGDRGGLARAAHDVVLLSASPAGLAVALLVATEGRLAEVVFGAEYAEIGGVVTVLSLGAWVALIGTVLSSVALAVGARQTLLIGTVAGLTTNILLNLVMLGRYGAIAAAWTSVVAYAVAAALFAVHPKVRPAAAAAIGTATRGGVAIGAAAVAGHAGGSMLVAATTATATYTLVLGGLHVADVRRLRSYVARLRDRSANGAA